MALYNYKVERGKKVIVWNPGRIRGIEKAKDRIGDIAKTARELLKGKGRIRILEIGCGYGRALLDLRKQFGEKIETYGINYESRWKVGLVRKFALANNLFPNGELEGNLPKVYIMDAGKRMRLPSSHFDLIFSQSTAQYIEDKAVFIQEVNRLLAPNGIARIDTQHRKNDYPSEYRNLFEIWEGSKPIEFTRYMGRFGNIQIKKAPERPEGYIVMRKAKRLDLGLKLMQTIDLHKISREWWGTKAVYVVEHKN